VRPRGDRPPERRIDYVLVGEGVEVHEADVPESTDPRFERCAALSDHLPVTVRLGLCR
jgi:endonuclease/exonuclease/phosphatase family metal-dependent hydrolase